MFFKFLRFLPVSLLAFFIAFPNALAEDSVKKEEKSPLSWSKRTVKKHPSLKIKSAVKNFNSNSSKKWKIRYNPLTGAPESIMEGRFKKRYPGRNPKERARAFLKDNAEMLNINTANLKEDKNNSFFGLNHVRYQQYYKGLPVEFSYTKVHIEEDGTVAGYQSSYNSDLDIDIVPSISAAQALQTASSDAGTTIKMSSHTLSG